MKYIKKIKNCKKNKIKYLFNNLKFTIYCSIINGLKMCIKHKVTCIIMVINSRAVHIFRTAKGRKSIKYLCKITVVLIFQCVIFI